MPSGYIIAEGQYLGAFKYARQPDDSWGWMSIAYFCSECGDIWARLVMQNSKGVDQPFRTTPVSCRRHYEPWGIPGSLLRGELRYNLDELSAECVKREFEVHLDYFESLI